jgi:hypothetical protein
MYEEQGPAEEFPVKVVLDHELVPVAEQEAGAATETDA